MDVIIKNNLSPTSFVRKHMVFNTIIGDLVSCKSRAEIEYEMKTGADIYSEYFAWGFGGSHFWLKELDSDGNACRELLFIEFKD